MFQDLWQHILPLLDSAHSFKELILSLLSSLSVDMRTIFAATQWSLWRGQNELLWENVAVLPRQIAQHATSFLGDWTHANALEAQASAQCIEVQQVKWLPPRLGFLKCNIDASFSEVNGKIIFGMCIGNEH